MAAKARTHRMLITLTFDRPCSPAEARAAARDNISGDFYPTAFRDSDPEKFVVRSFKPAPRRKP